MLISPRDSCLIVIDMQDRLVPAMLSPDQTIKNVGVLITAAKRLEIPALLTEQYPKGLGNIVGKLAEIAEGIPVIEKLHFSCMKDGGFSQTFKSLNRKQAIITGVEAHVCVLQTAIDLMGHGFEVFVVTDATSSRSLESEKACLDRLNACGASAGIVTTEMVLFEWLEQAGTAAFKELLPLIK